MKAFNGFEAKKAAGAAEQLPAGGYVAKILNAQLQSGATKNGDKWEQLVISFDIAEGNHKDFFAKQYKENTREDKKWKGNYRLNIPQEGHQYFDGQKRTFGNAIWSVEESNPGYHWDWNEDGLKGKMVGVLFRNAEWAKDGNCGWYTECCALTCVDDIRTGNFRQPKDKPLKNKDACGTPVFTPVPETDSELPF